MDLTVFCGIMAAVAAVFLIYGFCSNFFLKTEYYNVVVNGDNVLSLCREKPACGTGIKLVMLADLHGSRYGKRNEKLIDRIRRETPDIICFSGDMTVKDGRGTDVCLELCRELVRICPVYYAMGNHEIRMPEYETFLNDVRHTGVRVLDNQREAVIVRGRKLVLYGLTLEEEYYASVWKESGLSVEGINEKLGEGHGEGIRILLAHNPEFFATYRQWGAHLVLSGHVHGGIARLPVLGGVIAPSYRIFPRYDAGSFEEDGKIMILSRGMGTHHIRLRFFNLPELSVIRIC